ncbi:MAG: energy-coupling factor transporter transmembrane protein EcfT [Coriobacteriales bacterium]|jgi:energy-coupling factor transport system permease protein|nr:energy-coupling factor transporter transmembrane protein EcfT [Coriobacteriales bacterium]
MLSVLRDYHPAVAFVFFMAMITLCFLSLEPVFRIIGMLGSCAVALAVRGAAAFVRASWWLLLLVIIVTATNALFSTSGLTVLFYLGGAGGLPITLESLVYGCCSGLMLASVLVWFQAYNRLMSRQGFLALFSRVAPTAALITARITVFVPELVSHARQVNNAQTALGTSALSKQAEANVIDAPDTPDVPRGTSTPDTPGAPGTPGTTQSRSSRTSLYQKLRYASALSSQMMEWGMEKSLVTADSMRARGFGSTQRSSYRPMRLTRPDVVALATIILLGCLSGAFMLVYGGQFAFYPYLTGLSAWWVYVPYAVFCLFPFVLAGGERLAWTLSRSRA